MRMLFLAAVIGLVGCGPVSETYVAVSPAGVKATTTHIETGSDGLTTEQRNVTKRLQMDNKPGTIKHLYVFSAYSGQAIIYSTVKGKVTSSGKRLHPFHVVEYFHNGNGGWNAINKEAIQDDGTYGSSVEYIYWLDQREVYHQHYISGGQIVHVSSEPMPVKSIIVNVETLEVK